jgi:hypothetical protein
MKCGSKRRPSAAAAGKEGKSTGKATLLSRVPHNPTPQTGKGPAAGQGELDATHARRSIDRTGPGRRAGASSDPNTPRPVKQCTDRPFPPPTNTPRPSPITHHQIMLEVDVPSFLGLRSPRKPPTAEGAAAGGRGGSGGLAAGSNTRVLTCALAGSSNLLVFAFVSLLGAWAVSGDLMVAMVVVVMVVVGVGRGWKADGHVFFGIGGWL